MYDGTIYVGGEIRELGVDAVPADLTESRPGLAHPQAPASTSCSRSGGSTTSHKIVAGKQLWNYDNLEPTEKKLIL